MKVPPREDGIVVEQSGALGRPINAFINPACLYIATLQEGASRKTGRDFLRILARIMRWDDWAVAPWWKLTATETTYIRACLVRDYAPATARLAVNMLKGVLKQAFRVGLTDADTYQRAVMLPSVKGRSAVAGRMLTEEEVQKLAEEIGRLPSPRGVMLSALFATALGGGLRREELAILKVDDFSADDVHLLVHGKGRRERVQALPPWAGKTLRRWATLRATLGLVTPFLFVQVSATQVRDHGLSPWGVWCTITSVVKELHMEHFTPHDLRRTFASRMIDETDLVSVSKLMGHSNIQMTAHYDRRGTKAAEKAVAGLAAWGFDSVPVPAIEETPDVKKTIDIDPPAKPGLATIGEALRAKPTLSSIAAASPEAPSKEPEKSNVIQLHPQTGQRLVSRRIVAKPDYLRDGKPLDLEWVRRQCRALVARETLPMKIVEVLTKAGVRRGDGSKVWVDDVTRWSASS